MTLVESAMMRPPSPTCAAACASTRKAPRRFVAITLSKSARLPGAIGAIGITPALLTTTSIRP